VPGELERRIDGFWIARPHLRRARRVPPAKCVPRQVRVIGIIDNARRLDAGHGEGKVTPCARPRAYEARAIFNRRRRGCESVVSQKVQPAENASECRRNSGTNLARSDSETRTLRWVRNRSQRPLHSGVDGTRRPAAGRSDVRRVRAGSSSADRTPQPALAGAVVSTLRISSSPAVASEIAPPGRITI